MLASKTLATGQLYSLLALSIRILSANSLRKQVYSSQKVEVAKTNLVENAKKESSNIQTLKKWGIVAF